MAETKFQNIQNEFKDKLNKMHHNFMKTYENLPCPLIKPIQKIISDYCELEFVFRTFEEEVDMDPPTLATCYQMGFQMWGVWHLTALKQEVIPYQDLITNITQYDHGMKHGLEGIVNNKGQFKRRYVNGKLCFEKYINLIGCYCCINYMERKFYPTYELLYSETIEGKTLEKIAPGKICIGARYREINHDKSWEAGLKFVERLSSRRFNILDDLFFQHDDDFGDIGLLVDFAKKYQADKDLDVLDKKFIGILILIISIAIMIWLKI